MAAGPLEFVSMDLLGPFPESKKGKMSLLVITDRFSKLNRVDPMRTIASTAIVDVLLETWFLSYDIPKFSRPTTVHSSSGKY